MFALNDEKMLGRWIWVWKDWCEYNFEDWKKLKSGELSYYAGSLYIRLNYVRFNIQWYLGYIYMQLYQPSLISVLCK